MKKDLVKEIEGDLFIIPEEQSKRYLNEKIISLKNHYHKNGFFSMLINFSRELVDDFYEASRWH